MAWKTDWQDAIRNLYDAFTGNTQSTAISLPQLPTALDGSGGLKVAGSGPVQAAGQPSGTDIAASSATAAASNNLTLAAVAAKTTYITGFQVTGGGATAASVIPITITGLLGGTLNYALAIPAGAAVGVTPLVVPFPRPLPASAPNTAILVNVPTFGAGNTNAAASAQGFQL